MKLDKTQKQLRKTMLADLRAVNGKLFTNSFSGLTVAVRPACNVPNPKFFHVSTAQCDFVDDGFKRKQGEYLALLRLIWEGSYCIVPANYRSIEEIGYDAMEFFEMS